MLVKVFRRTIPASVLLWFVAAAGCSSLFCLVAAGQEKNAPPVEGYITAVHAPDGFDVNGTHVTTGPATHFGLFDNKGAKEGVPPSDAVRVGVRVRVNGTGAAQSVNAYSVLFFDYGDRKLAGFGVIDRMIAGGPEAEFQADGYRIRMAANTVTSFSGRLKTMADVGPDTWVKYEGKRDATGVLVAAKVAFVAARQGKVRAPPREAAPSQDNLIDAAGNFFPLRTKVRLSNAGGVCGWHRFPANPALQQRVWRVGMSVVPAYQKEMADDSPSKIYFRFYAVDEATIRSAISCNLGLILVPKQVVDRLKSDDQLAAVLADGVAYSLESQSAKLIAEFREILGAELAADIALSFVPGAFLASDVGAGLVEHAVVLHMQEERGRMALAMLADAGYDPWQAPAAWRLLAPKKLPGDVGALKYPDRSGYQLGILNLQYGREQAGAAQGDGVAQ